MFFILILSSIILNSVVQSSILIGDKKLTSIKNFNESAAAGVWYTVSSSTNPFEAFQNCPSYTFSWNPQTSSYNVVLTTKSAITKEFRTQTAILKKVESNPQIYEVFYSYIIPTGQAVLLDTDYVNYSVGVILFPKVSQNYVQIAFVYSRTPTLSPECIKTVSKVLAENNIDPSALKPVRQSDC